MAEAWTADLDYAEELGVDHEDIARGAIVFVVRRGAAAWCRRLWTRVVLIVLALLVALVLVPPWLLIPVVALGLLVWLIASPTRPSSEPEAKPNFPPRLL